MKKLLLVIIFMIASHTYAQISATGIVKDSVGNPLEMANMLAINSQTKDVDSYGFTDAKGNYRLNLKKNATYTIKVSYVGMIPLDVTINTKESDIKKDITLYADNTLDEVNLTYKMPVTVKGDTIVYNADSFTTGKEKKLGDVLENLPGMEVTDSGDIKVEGKKVKKVMVEGKDFFDGDSKLATKNIPANAVDKVEVLKNHNDVNQLKGVTDNEDSIAINIKLKEGKKNFWFGNIEAGSAVAREDARYLLHPKLFYYNPKFSLNFIGDLNNIGEAPFTFSDYFKFTGGFGGVRNSGTNFNISSSDFSYLAIKNNRAKDMLSRFGAFNFSYNPKKTWSLSGFVMHSGSEVTTEENSVRNYINIDESNDDAIATEKRDNFQNQQSNFTIAKLKSSYIPNSKNQFDYDAFVKLSNLELNRKLVSTQVTQNGTETILPIQELNKQTPFSIRQNANYYYTLNDDNIFALTTSYALQNEDPVYNAQLAQLSFVDQLGLGDQALYNLTQQKLVKTKKFDGVLDYYRVLTPKSNLNLSIGATVSNQQFNSSMFNVLGNGSQQELTDTTTKNDVVFKFTDYFAGLHYKFITGIFTFNQGVTLHQYKTENQQLGTEATKNFTKLLPDASIKVALNKSESLRLSYNMKVAFTDVNKVAEGYVFNNYSQLYAGNRFLENALLHNLRLNYSSFSSFNYTSFYAFLNYDKKFNVIKGATRLNGINRETSFVNTAFPDETVSLNANFQKRFRKFKFDLGGNASYSKFNNLFFSQASQQNENRSSNSFSQSYNTKLSTNFKDAPNVDIGYTIALNKYNQVGVSNNYVRHSPFINFEAYFLKNLSFSTKYTYNNYKNNGVTINNYSFWNADLTYQKKDVKLEYSLIVTNILNTKNLIDDYSNSIFSASSSYRIQPRFVMFKMKYNL